MEAISSQSLPFPPPSLGSHQTLIRRTSLLSLDLPQKLIHQKLRMRRTSPARAQALGSVLVATTNPARGDISVLLQLGGLMLFVYWIANFVVPEMIKKDLQESSTAAEEAQEEEEDEYEEEEKKENRGSMSIKAIGKKKKKNRKVMT